MRKTCDDIIALEDKEYIEKEGIKPICFMDEEYPEILKSIYDPPPVLFCKGSLHPADANAVAIVGSRRCSVYGLQMAERLAHDLAERGMTVISGMANGIDTAAHRGALKAKGRTIAVMGSGFRHIYPRGAEKLFSEIVESGAVLTEYVSETHPAKWNFPKRNRIISGMSKGVVVVEAARKSGAMITMNFALEQGREVFAVPGRVDSHTSGGTNKLIQEGAKLVTGVEDILEELNIEKNVIPNHKTQREKKKGKKALNEQQQRVLTTISGKNSIHIDQIYNLTKIKFQHLSGILLNLELKGLIRQLPGRSYHAG